MNANDVALVTGGNKGIGRQIVQCLAQRGYTVYLGARSMERGRSAVEELRSESGASRGVEPDIRFTRLDVTDPESVEASVNRIKIDSGRLDVLVNNAGIMSGWGLRTADITAAHLREVYEVNVFGVVTVRRSALT